MGVREFARAKSERRKLSLLTCYDYTFARLLAGTPIDAILVGDSAAMVMHGRASTVHAGIEMMRWHTEAVARGAGDKFVIADMPFLSFRKGVTAALDTAQTLMAAGAQAVKLEGGEGHEDAIERLTQSGIPVMGHLGLQPQSVHAYGGYRVQGRTEETAQDILGQAKMLEQLGAFSVVLECIPAALAREVTVALRIPTIGIGAGADCDGQILVLQDMLGLNADFQPKFVRKFLNGECMVKQAVESYGQAVSAGAFPSVEESFE